MTNKTLYISDMDGTLLNDRQELDPQTIELLNSLIVKGVSFTVATARSAVSASVLLEPLSINVPGVLLNGAMIYDFQKKCAVKTFSIPSDTAGLVKKALGDFGHNGFMFVYNNEKMKIIHGALNTDMEREFYTARIQNNPTLFELREGYIPKKEDTVMYFALLETEEKTAKMKEELSKIDGINIARYPDIYVEDGWFLEVFSKDAEKGTSTLYLKEQYGFDRVVAFGDNYNDVCLLEISDTAVAVENARDTVKEYADVIIGSNNHNSVAKFIEKEFLG